MFETPARMKSAQSRWAYGAGRRLCLLASIVVVIALLPFVFQGSYWRGIITICAINVMLALGLDFIFGYAGQLSLGHSAFSGIGAYTSTVLVTALGLNFWIALLCGVFAAGLAGVLLSAFAVRLKGHYLAIASLAFAVITYQILVNWISVTQGPLGIYGIPAPPPLTIPGVIQINFGNQQVFFYLAAGLALLSYLVLSNLTRSPIGDALTAVREDEISAASLGIRGTAWKLVAFGIGCAIAGLAGCLYASFIGTLVPDAFFVTESFTILAMVVIGGRGNLWGAVLGAVLLTVGPELLRGIGDFRLTIYGLALTLVALFLPGGLSGVLIQAARRIGRYARSAKSETHA
jgi:branched-chain amino acid transport system permease protein